MIKKFIAILFIVTFIMSGNLSYASIFEENPEVSEYDESDIAVTYFNGVRASIGLSPIEKNKALKDMAFTHSKYMNYNNVVSSVEESDQIFFRGRYPWDRATYFKYKPRNIYEFSKKGYTNFLEGIKTLINDPISRSIMLDPVYTEIGMANFNSYYTFELGGEASTINQFVNYPYKEQENVPVVWKNDNFKSYYKGVNGLPDEVGVPISLTYYGGNIKTYKNISVGMSNMNTNKSVPVIIIKPGENYLLVDTLVILPLVKYDQGTEYQIDISFNYNIEEKNYIVEKPFTKLFSFKTENNVSRSSTSPYMTRGMFTESLIRELVSSQGFDYQLIEPLEAGFSDVGINHFRSIYIYTASTEGLIAGFPDNEFKPELNITKEQAYTILVKAYEKTEGPIKLPGTDRLSSYLDHQTVSSWAYESVQKAVELGIIADKKNLIKPGDYLTEEDYDNIIGLYQKVIN